MAVITSQLKQKLHVEGRPHLDVAVVVGREQQLALLVKYQIVQRDGLILRVQGLMEILLILMAEDRLQALEPRHEDGVELGSGAGAIEEEVLLVEGRKIDGIGVQGGGLERFFVGFLRLFGEV